MKPDSGIIIVTGSNGRIGDAVMRRFAGRYSDVVGFDRKSHRPPPPGCVYVPVEITSDVNVREGLTVIRQHHGSHVAAVVHLAAYYDFFGEPSRKYEEITINGTGRLLRTLHELDFQVEQFLFSSTMLVHEPAEPGQFINEDWPIGPTWAYPASKVRTEAVITELRGEIPVVFHRIAGVYGGLLAVAPSPRTAQPPWPKYHLLRVAFSTLPSARPRSRQQRGHTGSITRSHDARCSGSPFRRVSA